MPNWTINTITFASAADAAKAAAFVESDDSLFDFGRIAPMPAVLNVAVMPSSEAGAFVKLALSDGLGYEPTKEEAFDALVASGVEREAAEALDVARARRDRGTPA